MGQRGRLLVVATPIGNLGDVTERLREALAGAQLVLAEDTRRTRQLLRHLGLERPLRAHHRFNEAASVEALIGRLRSGEVVALVSDAGTPTVSDPGSRLVAAALEEGLRVEPIPGPSATVAALSVSGLPADRFYFAGFLPPRRAARRRELAALSRRAETLVLFEAPHRLVEALRDMAELLGERDAVLCRELTKHFEEIRRAPLPALAREVADRARVQGEIVLVVAGAGERGTSESAPPSPDLVASWKAALASEEQDHRRALKRLARELGASRLEVKRRLEECGLLDPEGPQERS